MVGVFADNHAGHGCLGWHAALDQAGFGRGLHNARLAGTTGIFGAAGHDHTELGGDDVEPLGSIFTDDLTLSPAAALDVIRFDYLLDARQVLGQMVPVGFTWCGS